MKIFVGQDRYILWKFRPKGGIFFRAKTKLPLAKSKKTLVAELGAHKGPERTFSDYLC